MAKIHIIVEQRSKKYRAFVDDQGRNCVGEGNMISSAIGELVQARKDLFQVNNAFTLKTLKDLKLGLRK